MVPPILNVDSHISPSVRHKHFTKPLFPYTCCIFLPTTKHFTEPLFPYTCCICLPAIKHFPVSFLSIHMCLHTIKHSVSEPYKIIINFCFVILIFLLWQFPKRVLRHLQISLPVSSWRDWNSSVSIVTNVWTGRPANRSVFLAGLEISIFTIATRSTLGKNHSLNQVYNDCLPHGKATGTRTRPLTSIFDHAEIKNAWSYTSTPKHILMAWCVIEHRDIVPRHFKILKVAITYEHIFTMLGSRHIHDMLVPCG
jgi:hypothetical protein